MPTELKDLKVETIQLDRLHIVSSREPATLCDRRLSREEMEHQLSYTRRGEKASWCRDCQRNF
jgi:hypothetical protein